MIKIRSDNKKYGTKCYGASVNSEKVNRVFRKGEGVRYANISLPVEDSYSACMVHYTNRY